MSNEVFAAQYPPEIIIAPVRKVKNLPFVGTASPITPPQVEPSQFSATPSVAVPQPVIESQPVPSEPIPSAPVNPFDAFNAAMNNPTDIAPPSVPSTSQGYVPQGVADDVTAQSPSGRLVVMSEPTVYIPKDSDSAWQSFFFVMFDGKGTTDAGGLFNVDGRPEPLQIFSTDGKVAGVAISTNGIITNTFSQPGSAVLTFTVGSETVQKTINVVEVPIAAANTFVTNTRGSTVAGVTQLLGFPDTQETLTISYPKSETKDCVYYTPKFLGGNSFGLRFDNGFGSGHVFAKHFYYNSKYRGLVVVFVNDNACAISLKGRTLSPTSTVMLPARIQSHNARSMGAALSGGCGAPAVLMIAIFVALWYSFRYFV